MYVALVEFRNISTSLGPKFNIKYFFYRCTVHSDIHTVHSPTNAHLLELRLKLTLKLDGSYMFRSTTIIRELAIEPG